MANIVYIATSIDGFIARKDGNIDWLMEVPEAFREKAEIVTGNLETIGDSLKLKGFNNLYIDELVITRIPVILGSGIPLFAEMGMEIKLDLVNTEILNKDLVKSTYIRNVTH